MASHVPRAAAIKQALADEHQRKTELLKKQKRAGGLLNRRPSSSLNPRAGGEPGAADGAAGHKPKSFYGKNYSAQQSLFGAKSRGATLAHAGQTGMAVARSAPVPTLPAARRTTPPRPQAAGAARLRRRVLAAPRLGGAAAAAGRRRAARVARRRRNTGNTCYINAVLSAVLGLRPFVRDLLTAPLFTQLSPKLPNLSVFRSLYDLSSRRAKTAAAAAASGGGIVGADAKLLKEAIAQRCSQFAGGGQQDAHEFLVDMIDALHEELLAASAAVAADEITPPLGAAAPLPPPPPEASLPTALNYRARSSTSSAARAAPTSGRAAPPRRPARPAARRGGAAAVPASVDRMLESFFAEEPLEVACEKCGHDTACVRHRVSRLPRVLVLQLKRFEYGAFGVRKRTDAVRCTPTVDLGFCCKPVQPPPPLTAPMPKPSPAAASAAAGSRPTDGATRRILDFNQRSPMAPPARSPLPPSSAGRGAARGAPGSVGKLNVERVGGGSPSAAGRRQRRARRAARRRPSACRRRSRGSPGRVGSSRWAVACSRRRART